MNLLKNNIVHLLFRKFKDVTIINGKIWIFVGLLNWCLRSLIWVFEERGRGGEGGREGGREGRKEGDRDLIFDEFNCLKINHVQ